MEAREMFEGEIGQEPLEPEWVRYAHAMFQAWGPMTADGAWFDYQTKAQLLVAALNDPETETV